MDKPLSYPLEQLMIIKKNRFDQAVKTLEEKKKILTKRSRDNQFQKNRELHDKKDFIDGKGVQKAKKKTNFILSPKTKKKK